MSTIGRIPGLDIPNIHPFEGNEGHLLVFQRIDNYVHALREYADHSPLAGFSRYDPAKMPSPEDFRVMQMPSAVADALQRKANAYDSLVKALDALFAYAVDRQRAVHAAHEQMKRYDDIAKAVRRST